MGEGLGEDGLGEVGAGGQGLGIGELDTDHQAAAADLRDAGMAGGRLAQTAEKPMAQRLGAGDQALVLEHVEGCQRRRA